MGPHTSRLCSAWDRDWPFVQRLQLSALSVRQALSRHLSCQTGLCSGHPCMSDPEVQGWRAVLPVAVPQGRWTGL